MTRQEHNQEEFEVTKLNPRVYVGLLFILACYCFVGWLEMPV